MFRSDFDVKFFHDKNILNGLNGEMATYSHANIPQFVINLPQYLFNGDEGGPGEDNDG